MIGLAAARGAAVLLKWAVVVAVVLFLLAQLSGAPGAVTRQAVETTCPAYWTTCTLHELPTAAVEPVVESCRWWLTTCAAEAVVGR
jgi:hypothetical protein